MSVRTLEELRDAVRRAAEVNDPEPLEQYAAELQQLATPEALAFRESVMGLLLGMRSQYTQALEHQERALAMHQELGDRHGEAKDTANIGSSYWDTGELTKALEYFNRAIELYEENGQRNDLPGTLSNIANIYAVTGEYARSLEYNHRALALHQELDQPNGEASVLCNIGILHEFTSNYPSALEYLHRALEMFESLGNRRFMANVLTNIGALHNLLEDQDKARDHFERALAVYEELGNLSGIAVTTGNLGEVIKRTAGGAEGLPYLIRAFDMQVEIGDRRAQSHLLCNIVIALMAMELWEDARARLLELESIETADPIAMIARSQARASIQFHDEQFDDAATTLHGALSMARDLVIPDSEAKIHVQLRDLAMKRNDLAAYVEHNNEYTRITNEINGKDTATKLAMQEAERRITKERQMHEKQLAVLYSALPKHIADRVARGETVNDQHDNAVVLFMDIVGFTTISDRIPSGHVVHLLEQIFTTLDAVCRNHGVVKIKTIGDSYMAASFANTEHLIPNTGHVVGAGLCAIEMLAALNALEITMPPELGDTSWTTDVGDIQVRIGMHCGPVTAGVIGTERMQYDVWGDTVNTASRMESHGEPGRIHVSESFATALQSADGGHWTVDDSNDSMTNDSMTLFKRGEISIKGKGTMQTYWLVSTT